VQDTKDTNAQSGHSAGDAAPGLFTPDILLASQQSGSGIPDSPCRRLVGSVLERALLDVAGPSARDAERADALAWFRSDHEAPFSFRWIAHQLGIDPDWLRSRIEARQRPAGPPSSRVSESSPTGTSGRRAA
jgi:hypothetical protein